MRPAVFIPLMALSLAACEATPPSIGLNDIVSFNETTAAAQDLAPTSVSNLPSGTVTYTGEFGSDATVEDAENYSMIGDMVMRVFFESQQIDGHLDNINLIRNGIPQQRMDGFLLIDGNAVNGIIVADADGTLYRVDANKTDYAFTDLELIGSVRTGLDDGDVVAGTVTGSGNGSFDFELDGNGTFYGVAEQ